MKKQPNSCCCTQQLQGLIPDRQCRKRRKSASLLLLTAGALLGAQLPAVAQASLFTVTGGSTNVTTQTVTAFNSNGGNWFPGSSIVAPTISGVNSEISSSTAAFAYGNSSSVVPASPASGGNKIIFPGNKTVSSFTLGNLTFGPFSAPQLEFNLLLLGGNGNPTFTVKYTGSFGERVVTLPATDPNVWTEVVAAVPADVLTATGAVTLTFERTGNTSGANGAHFWAVDDIAITSGTPATSPCPVVTANTYSWNGAGSASGTSSSDFNDLANWCPQPASLSALASATLQLNLVSTATITLDGNFTATAIEASIAGNDNQFLLNLNSHSLTIAGNLTAGIASGNGNTSLEIRTGSGTLTVNGIAQIGNNGASGKVGFGATPDAGIITFNGPLVLGQAAGMFSPSPKTVNLKSWLTNHSAQMATGGFAESTVIFNGATAQTISGTQDLRFGNMTVSNAQNVTSTDVNVLVPGTLTMNIGLLTTAEQAKVKLGATGQISEKAMSYVVGHLEAESRNISTSPQTFGGMGISIVAGSGPYATYVNRITSLYNFSIQHGNSQNYVEKQAIKRKYQISVTNAPADLDATLTLNYWAHELSGIPTQDLGFFRENPTAPGTWTSRGRDALNLPNNNLAGSITLSHIAAFSTWSVGGESTTLPVELMWFTAKNIEHSAMLEWATATESKNAGFQIEASNDNYNYETIGFINAQSTRNHNAEYSFSEPQQASRRGVRYYRLTQHDTDGANTVLGIRYVTFEGSGTTVTTSPNPFSYGFTALIDADAAQSASVTLIDALGRVAAQQDVQLTKGNNQIDFNGQELSQGIYVLRVKLAKEIITTKVQKQ